MILTGWILTLWGWIKKYVNIEETNIKPDCPITVLHIVPEYTVLTVLGKPIRAIRNDLTPDQLAASKASEELPVVV
jgi:hypothetical protein